VLNEWKAERQGSLTAKNAKDAKNKARRESGRGFNQADASIDGVAALNRQP